MAGSQTQESCERAGIYINKHMALVCLFFEAVVAQQRFERATDTDGAYKKFHSAQVTALGPTSPHEERDS
jgi:hypothetical protein